MRLALAITPELRGEIRQEPRQRIELRALAEFGHTLEMTHEELDEEIDRRMRDNPMLEKVCDEGADEAESADPRFAANSGRPTPVAAEYPPAAEFVSATADDWGRPGAAYDDEESIFERAEARVSLREHLHGQACGRQIDPKRQRAVRALIELVDADGFLRETDEALKGALAQIVELDDGELHDAIRHLQTLDPPGVGARTMSERLLLQLQDPDFDCADEGALDLAKKIARAHIDDLAARRPEAIRRALGCTAEALDAAVALIRCLNPHPTAAFTADDNRYVTPEIIVRKVGGRWLCALDPRTVPILRVRPSSANTALTARDRKARREQLREAYEYADRIARRCETIRNVAQAIVDAQTGFLENGPMAIVPLSQRQVAERAGVDASTVSRATRQKYIDTPRGTFELASFFRNRVGDHASDVVTEMVRAIVGAETPQTPLSDDQIARRLHERGARVARRTVAKYREAIGIPGAARRRAVAQAAAARPVAPAPGSSSSFPRDGEQGRGRVHTTKGQAR